MASSWIRAAVVLVALGLIWFTYGLGRSHGRAEITAQTNAQVLANLQASMTEYADLIDASRRASVELREQLANREAADEKSTRTLRTILAASRADRDSCRFDDDSMRSLAAARDRAAAAAASGIGRTVSGSDGGGQ